ncbi:MAG: diguanylate cyclase (GGDEF)-like protein [Clostridium sp.]|jgi:diguanylate cyclase (GGDEF)-like protein
MEHLFMFHKINLFIKKKNLIGVLLVIIMFSLCGCSIKDNNIPKASEGKLDLSNWNFEKDGTILLDGQWELYWEQLLEPKDFKNNAKKKTIDFLKVPGSLTTTVNNKKLPKYGYGTMRLLINMNADKDKLYGIRTQFILSASKIWINGKLATSVGVVSKDESNATGSFEHQISAFSNEGSEVEIVIQMSNFNNIKGKVTGIILGNTKQIKREYIVGVATDLIIFGCIFIIGIYHFALYYKRQKCKESMYFGVFCLIIALRNLLVSQRVIFEFYPDIPFSIFNKIAYLTAYLALPFLTMFLSELFDKEISRKVVNIVKIVSIGFSLITIFTNIEFYDKFLIYFEVFSIIILSYILFNVVKATISKKQGAFIILFGFVVFLITIVHDMFLQAGILYTNSLAPSGFVIFIFSQAYMLASKFSNAFTEVEKLVEENKAMYTDELTGLLNRRGFYDQVGSLYKDEFSTNGKFVMFYGDLNKLKTINDSFGHKEGDEALMMTAKILKKSFGQEDIVARMSGDEFTAIAVNKESEEEAKQSIKNINTNFYKYNSISKKPYRLSISIGYAIYLPNLNAKFEDLMHEADTMLYAEKSKLKSYRDR